MAITLATIAQTLELPDAVMYGVAERTWAVFGPAVTKFEMLLATAAPAVMSTVDTLVTENQHPYSSKLPLMKASYVLFALLMYAVALAVLYPVGKLLGKHKYRFIGLIHNAFLFFLSLYMCTGIAVSVAAAGYHLWNNPVGRGPEHWRIAKLLWLFYVSKLPEFGDTFLMMLKQNYRQISFLHLYHHGTIFVIWFIVVNKAPGGEAYWSAMVNSGVHVVMYGYYAGTLLFTDGPVRRFLNNFKFVITKGQMTQFVLNCVQSVYDLLLVDVPRYPPFLIHLLFWYMLTLLALFGNFLAKNKGRQVDDVSSPSGSPVASSVKESKKRN